MVCLSGGDFSLADADASGCEACVAPRRINSWLCFPGEIQPPPASHLEEACRWVALFHNASLQSGLFLKIAGLVGWFRDLVGGHLFARVDQLLQRQAFLAVAPLANEVANPHVVDSPRRVAARIARIRPGFRVEVEVFRREEIHRERLNETEALTRQRQSAQPFDRRVLPRNVRVVDGEIAGAARARGALVQGDRLRARHRRADRPAPGDREAAPTPPT